ncbi:MAG: LacI family DNA-binding transcriptional regulator [Selenomonadaceae bacterium]|nr:LacI family DNA-binding transcriptional regulator [Selenomonadaceae bacterium]
MITIKQIAELCGVSRGTVDRVINGRGKVKEEKRKLILKTMEEFGYKPNPAARALVTQRQGILVGVVLSASEIDFFEPIIEALKKSAGYYQRVGLQVRWKLLKGYHAEEQCAAIVALRKAGAEAILINPLNEPVILQELEDCIRHDIFVVALNNDFDSKENHIYVGSDYGAGGRTAAALLQKICPAPIHVGIAYSGARMLGHMHRIQGFRERLSAVPGAVLEAVSKNDDDPIKAYDETLQMLEAHPDLNAIFIATSGGARGVCQALVKKRCADRITVVSFDTIPAIQTAMRAGIIDAAIYQHPRRQGQIAMQMAYDYLIGGIKPAKKQYLVQNEIRILENL